MDYEKKLALAKEALDSGSYDKETIEYIFPELKESEGERIRKEIIDYLKQRLKRASSIPTAIGRWINWLEAQAEQKPAEWTEEDEKMYTATIFALAGFMGNEDKLDWLKSLKDRVPPQKQEWNYNDEIIIETIIQ